MLVGGRLLLVIIFILSSSLLLNIKGDFLNTKERRKRHIFPLLGYLHGYKIGQDFALQLPPFVLSPLIIVPVNQQQSINIQKSGTGESFQENGGIFQTDFPVKLTLNSSVIDIKANFKFSSDNCTLDNNVTDINDTFRQINPVTQSPTEYIKDDLKPTTNIFETTQTENFTPTESNITAAVTGFYPGPAYSNKKLNVLQLTTSSIGANLELSSLEDKGKNASEKNNTENKTSEVTQVFESASSRIASLQYTTERFNPRPNTRYYNPQSFWHNAEVDQLSITTNSYREEEKGSPLPPRYDDRWRRFSSLSKVVLPVSGFKPLAGLYYDGFLHKSPTKKTGFIPFDKYYNQIF